MTRQSQPNTQLPTQRTKLATRPLRASATRPEIRTTSWSRARAAVVRTRKEWCLVASCAWSPCLHDHLNHNKAFLEKASVPCLKHHGKERANHYLPYKP